MTDNAHPRRTTRRSAAPNFKDNNSLKIRIRGRDDAPMPMKDMKQGLHDLAVKFEAYGPDYRVKRATLYVVVVDDKGQEVQLNKSGEMSIFPYISAADEHNVP